MLYKSKYMEFGSTFAAEKLKEEDGCDVHRETLRLWLKAAGLWVDSENSAVHAEIALGGYYKLMARTMIGLVQANIMIVC